MLHELARIGMAIAERLNQQHSAAVAATPPGAARAALHRDVGLAFLRISRAVRLTLAMFGRVQEAREALAAGVGPRAAVETARAPTRHPDDRDLKAEGDKLEDGPDPAGRAHGLNRPDRESLTELADFGFSLDRCRPGEVVARIYRGLGLPPDPARWPQAWPAPADGKGPHSRGVGSPEPLRVSGLSHKRDLFGTAFRPSAVIPAKAGISYRSIGYEIPAFAGMTNRGFLKRSGDPRITSEGERQAEACPLPLGPPDDSS